MLPRNTDFGLQSLRPGKASSQRHILAVRAGNVNYDDQITALRCV
jgi:hypothetical protein